MNECMASQKLRFGYTVEQVGVRAQILGASQAVTHLNEKPAIYSYMQIQHKAHSSGLV